MAHALNRDTDPKPETRTVAPNRPDFDSEAVWNARVDLAACFRFAARLGMHEGICNHFSAVLPGHDDVFLVNPYGYAFSELTASPTADLRLPRQCAVGKWRAGSHRIFSFTRGCT